MNIDNHKLMYHPERVAEWRQKGDCYPIYIEIGPTNTCNHRCVFCALDYLGYGKDFIEKDTMLSAIKDMADNGVKSVMFAGEGEPLLHKDIGSFVEESKKQGIDVSMTTNGVAFNDKKIQQILPNLSWLRFSIDSGSDQNYAKIHGTAEGDFKRVIKNIEKCVEYKRENNLEVTIGAQFLVIPQNMNQVSLLAQTLKEIGADNFQIKPYSHHPQSLNSLLVDLEDYEALEKELTDPGNLQILFRKETATRIHEGINYKECTGLPFFALIDSKANIIPCNLFYNNDKFTYGNLYKNSFSEIWKSKKRKQVIQKLNEKGCEDCRSGCRLDVVNRYLNRLKEPEPYDNFI